MVLDPCCQCVGANWVGDTLFHVGLHDGVETELSADQGQVVLVL